MTVVTDGGGEEEGDADFGLLFVDDDAIIILGWVDGHFVGGGHFCCVNEILK